MNKRIDQSGKTQVIQQDLALDTYLNSLLAEIPTSLSEELPVQEPKMAQIVALPVVPAAKVIVSEVKREKSKAEVPLLTEVRSDILQPKASQVSEKSQDFQAAKISQDAKIHPVSLMPEWSRHEFSALLFRVGELILATPLTELTRTFEFNRKPTLIPIQPSWFLGLLEDQGKKIGILDTGQLLLGKTRGSQRDVQTQPFTKILVSSDGNWGLACDEVLSITKISPEKVRWRTLRQQKPWLIGTLIDELTAVVDLSCVLPRKKVN